MKTLQTKCQVPGTRKMGRLHAKRGGMYQLLAQHSQDKGLEQQGGEEEVAAPSRGLWD